jgi:GNAT superfamily N-acetyltransferase
MDAQDQGSQDAPIQIRRATPADALAVSKVLHDSFVEFEPLYTPRGFAATTPNAQQVLARMEEGPVWIALHDRDAIGTIAAVAKGDSLYIRGMAVLPNARRSKVAARLLNEVERYAVENGCNRMFLSTTPFLDTAIRLYERFGFRRMNGAHDLFDTPLFMMEKLLPV